MQDAFEYAFENERIIMSRIKDTVKKVAVVGGDKYSNWLGLVCNLNRMTELNFFKGESESDWSLWKKPNRQDRPTLSDNCAIIFTGNLGSLEVMYTVYRLMTDNPHHVFVCAGNHEGEDLLWSDYGFINHLESKLGSDRFKQLSKRKEELRRLFLDNPWQTKKNDARYKEIFRLEMYTKARRFSL